MTNKKRKCLVGHDDDGWIGWLIMVVLVIIVVMIIAAIIFYGGVFIGGFHSLKNYFVSLKHNVWDSNRKHAHAN